MYVEHFNHEFMKNVSIHYKYKCGKCSRCIISLKKLSIGTTYRKVRSYLLSIKKNSGWMYRWKKLTDTKEYDIVSSSCVARGLIKSCICSIWFIPKLIQFFDNFLISFTIWNSIFNVNYLLWCWFYLQYNHILKFLY